jgi:hypothetical protein
VFEVEGQFFMWTRLNIVRVLAGCVSVLACGGSAERTNSTGSVGGDGAVGGDVATSTGGGAGSPTGAGGDSSTAGGSGGSDAGGTPASAGTGGATGGSSCSGVLTVKETVVRTQADVEALRGVSKVEGSLLIDAVRSGPTDLRALSCLTEVTGTLLIATFSPLKSLEGLEQLERAGKLEIVANPALVELGGIS